MISRPWVPLALAVVATLTACGPDTHSALAPASATHTPAATVSSASKDAGTVSQRNALRAAQSYIDTEGFSKKGLIAQLSSNYADKFSKADATWAVEHLDVDWNEQAVRAGRAYLDLGGFSRARLIDQLSSAYGNQFTRAQAAYAADKLGLK